jgi:hypothetical protein
MRWQLATGLDHTLIDGLSDTFGEAFVLHADAIA